MNFSGSTFDMSTAPVIENGKARELTEFESLGKQLGEWADAQFGYNRPPLSSINHLIEEAEELADAPYDRMEYADVLLLTVDAARRAGISPRELLHHAFAKLQINRRRKWGKVNAQGYVKHID